MALPDERARDRQQEFIGNRQSEDAEQLREEQNDGAIAREPVKQLLFHRTVETYHERRRYVTRRALCKKGHGSSTAAQLDLEGTTSSHNGASGVVSSGANASIRISNCTIDHNVAVGLLPYLGGQILSYGNNKVSGNGGGDGSVTGTATVM